MNSRLVTVELDVSLIIPGNTIESTSHQEALYAGADAIRRGLRAMDGFIDIDVADGVTPIGNEGIAIEVSLMFEEEF